MKNERVDWEMITRSNFTRSKVCFGTRSKVFKKCSLDQKCVLGQLLALDGKNVWLICRLF